MNQLPNHMILAISEINSTIPKVELRDRLIHAMNQARQHWLITDEQEQFRCAAGAVMLSYPPESVEFKRLESEMRNLYRLSVILQATQVGLEIDLENFIDSFQKEINEHEPIGLLSLWRELRVKGNQ